MIRNIIFDWSGTLVDDLPAVWRATNGVFRKAGVAELSLDQFRSEFCLPFERFYQRYVSHVGITQLEEWFHGHFREVQATVAELPHAREFLGFCRERGMKTFLLSTVHRDYYAAQSHATGFAEFIEHPYVEIWDKREKIGEILGTHQLNPAETMFIGDMQHDIETARHGGVISCAVLTGYNRLDQLRASDPDLIVENLGELQQLLERNGFVLSRHAGRHSPAPPAEFPMATVGALIFNQAGEVLMIQTRKWSNLWGIPGGKIKWGEPASDALRREIKEETNLDVTDIRFVLVQDCIQSKEFYREAHFVLLNYTCRVSGPTEVTLNAEAQAWRWVTVEAALSMELNQPTRRLIQAVQSASGVRR